MKSIEIEKWAGGEAVEESWRSTSELAGWTRADGARAIETNGDPVFEEDEGFEDLWEKRAWGDPD